jgi:hypothetical protein
VAPRSAARLDEEGGSMTTMTGRPGATQQREGGSVVRLPELWGAVAIASMWLAVLFVGSYGGDFSSLKAGTQTTTFPAAVLVALFACIGTVSVARRAFRRDGR